MIEISTGIFVTMLIGVFSLVTGIIVVLIKHNGTVMEKALGAAKEFMEKSLTHTVATLKADLDNHAKSLMSTSKQLTTSRLECENRCINMVNEIKQSQSRLRDRWEDFLEKYTVLDATRDNKLNALFRTVDELRTVIRDVPMAVTTKVDAASKNLKTELKLFIREEMR